MKITEIKINPKNPRKIDKSKVEKLAQSIESFPKMMELRPIVINGEGMILGGNMRYRALKQLGYKEIPDHWVKTADKLTEEEQRRFVVEDNVGFGEWDWDMLLDGWEKEELDDWGLDLDVTNKSGGKWENDYENDYSDEMGDGIPVITGYNLSSVWKDITHQKSFFYEHAVTLPEKAKTNRVEKRYSRSCLEEIERIVKTYMEEGDFFFENCCGWSTFSCIASALGFSGKGVDIWDTALEYSRKQYGVVKKQFPKHGNYEIFKCDGKKTPFKDEEFDFVYCNPPFLDVEMYGGGKDEIANNDEELFWENMKQLAAENYRVLKDGGLCVMVINDQRNKGFLKSTHSDLIKVAELVGFRLWDIVIAELVKGANLILRKKRYNNKQTAKQHEYVITFAKGNPQKRKITAEMKREEIKKLD